MNNKEKYEQICFSLHETEKELDKISIDIFTYNPKIDELTQKIKDLTNEKVKLEFEIKGDNNSNE